MMNLEHIFANDIDFESQLADWFDLFYLMKQTKETHIKALTMDNLTVWPNINTMVRNAGGTEGKYNCFVYFNKPELMLQYLSLAKS